MPHPHRLDLLINGPLISFVLLFSKFPLPRFFVLFFPCTQSRWTTTNNDNTFADLSLASFSSGLRQECAYYRRIARRRSTMRSTKPSVRHSIFTSIVSVVQYSIDTCASQPLALQLSSDPVLPWLHSVPFSCSGGYILPPPAVLPLRPSPGMPLLRFRCRDEVEVKGNSGGVAVKGERATHMPKKIVKKLSAPRLAPFFFSSMHTSGHSPLCAVCRYDLFLCCVSFGFLFKQSPRPLESLIKSRDWKALFSFSPPSLPSFCENVPPKCVAKPVFATAFTGLIGPHGTKYTYEASTATFAMSLPPFPKFPSPCHLTPIWWKPQ